MRRMQCENMTHSIRIARKDFLDAHSQDEQEAKEKSNVSIFLVGYFSVALQKKQVHAPIETQRNVSIFFVVYFSGALQKKQVHAPIQALYH